MDEDTRNFLQHIHDSLERRMAATATKDLAALERRLDATVTKEDLAAPRTAIMDLRNSALHYSGHVDMLLNEFAGSQQRGLSAEIAELKRRVAALELRMPPEYA